MRHILTFTVGLVVAAALGGCDTPDGETPERYDSVHDTQEHSATGSDGVVAGVITAVDTSPLAYDGNATLEIDAGGEQVVVAVPARVNLCAAEGLELVFELASGDAVEVRGDVREDVVVPCESAAHYIRRDR